MLNASSMSILLIVNPAAGKLRAKNGLYEMIAPLCAAGMRVTVYTTSARGEAAEVARSIGGEFDRIICCGGDGTLNEVIDGMLGGGVHCPLGYIPAGSTNDFAATLGLPADLGAAARLQLKGEPRSIDIGCFNDKRHFSYIASFGAFTSSSYTAPQTAKNALGHLAYVLEGIKDLPALQPVTLSAVTDDGRSFAGSYIFGAVSNCTSIGGMVKLDASLVDLSDGMFEVLLIRMPKTIVELNRILYALTSRDYTASPEFELTRVRCLTVTTPKPMPWSLDGEYEEGGTTAVICAMPGALRIIA
ncbi:MAG: diacylglycerol kinase family lipid kinase [Clostridia bacterium]|nr:diacylglycerol kinase family lipid kinase [Clostridia bacterium]